jgi:hypothetical protein
MVSLPVVLRIVHVLGAIYWAGTIFFFVTYLEPSLRSLGPDGGKVMAKLFERGYLTVLPIIALLTIIAGFWLLWIVSAGFDSAWMGSRLGISLSTGGALATIAFLVGLFVMRPAAVRIWAIMREMPSLSEEQRNARMNEMASLRARTSMAARAIFVLLLATALLMAVARYI